jgi:hypothetical protein
MRKFYIGLGAVLLTGIFVAAAAPGFDVAGIKARQDYAAATTIEAGPDADISFGALGLGDTDWAISVFPKDQVGCDAVLDITQQDIGATLWAKGFRTMSCVKEDRYGWPVKGEGRKLTAPRPPAGEFKPLPRDTRREIEAIIHAESPLGAFSGRP